MKRWRITSVGQLVSVGLLALVLADAATIVTATNILRANVKDRAMDRLESNMQVAWRLLHDLGPTVRIEDGRMVGGTTVLNGNFAFVDDLQQLVGGVATVFQGDRRITTNVLDVSGKRGVETHLDEGPVYQAVLRDHRSFRGTVNVLGEPYYSGYDPIMDPDGHVIGILFVGYATKSFVIGISAARTLLLTLSGLGLAVVIALFLHVGRRSEQNIAQREQRLRQSNTMLDAALDNMANGLAIWTAENRLALYNRQFCEICGLQSDALQVGMDYRAFLTAMQLSGAFKDRLVDDVLAQRQELWRSRRETSYQETVAGDRLVNVLHRPMPDGRRLVSVEDVTERTKAEEQISFMARHDALTGLANRLLFNERLLSTLGERQQVALLCLDLDHFKHVNDTHGHPAGDQLLREVADRLRCCVRGSDTIARLGGDEFAIIQEDVQDPRDAAVLAERIIEALAEPVKLGSDCAYIGVSIGIVYSVDAASNADDLLKRADLALYQAKNNGRGTFSFYESEMEARMQARRTLESNLRTAFAEEQFEIFYQPLVRVRDQSISGFEALIRWRHPTEGLINPADFIPVAEEMGLIGALGSWVLRRACMDAASWPAGLKVAINLSPEQFKNSALAEETAAALALSGLPGNRLELEITEAVLMQDNISVLATLHALRAQGIRIAMDDFGTGYSSLSYLQRFPFDKIKIDQSFVRGMADRDDCRAIIHAVIGLGHSLGIAVNAEGVETMDQFTALQSEGCGEVQGYLFSKPCSPRRT